MTEKDYNPERRNRKVAVNTKLNEKIVNAPIKEKEIKTEEKSEDKKTEEQAKEEPGRSKTSISSAEDAEQKKPIQKKPVVKKTEAVVNGNSLPISTKTSGAICRFIKYKKINDAIADLEKVIAKKKAVPMRGEIPHRKGKIMAGRFPQRAAKHFVELLKTLSANANVNGLESPIIVEAFANRASEPYGRFGRVQKKRTHIKIKCMEKMIKQNKKNKQK